MSDYSDVIRTTYTTWKAAVDAGAGTARALTLEMLDKSVANVPYDNDRPRLFLVSPKRYRYLQRLYCFVYQRYMRKLRWWNGRP